MAKQSNKTKEKVKTEKTNLKKIEEKLETVNTDINLKEDEVLENNETEISNTEELTKIEQEIDNSIETFNEKVNKEPEKVSDLIKEEIEHIEKIEKKIETIKRTPTYTNIWNGKIID